MDTNLDTSALDTSISVRTSLRTSICAPWLSVLTTLLTRFSKPFCADFDIAELLSNQFRKLDADEKRNLQIVGFGTNLCTNSRSLTNIKTEFSLVTSLVTNALVTTIGNDAPFSV